MPRRVESFTPVRRSYPWDEWMDGSSWEAIRGIDFDSEPRVFRVFLHGRARKKGMHVATSIREDTVYFRFYEKTAVA